MNNSEQSNHFKTGDLVIGTSDPGKSVYSPTGVRLLKEGIRLFGKNEDLETQQKQMEEIAYRNGGKSTKFETIGKKTKSKKTNITKADKVVFDNRAEDFPNFENSHEAAKPKQLESILFENDFGKIRAKVEHIVEHPQAFMLVFPDEDSMVFEPKVGEMLSLYVNQAFYATRVYYPGVTFDSPDSNRKFMILFKVPEENQE